LTKRQRGVLFGASRVAAANIGVSKFIADELVLGGVPARKVSYVLNAVDGANFSPDNDGSGVRAEFGFGPNDVVALQLARVWRPKRQEDFVRALALAREHDSRLKGLVVGWDDPQYDGTYATYRDELRALAASLGIAEHVHFHPARPDAAAVMAAADIVCLPSVDEPCALVVFEALATGKAFIGARSGGTPEVVQDGRTGLLHDPMSARSLADAIVQFAADPAKRATFGAAARADMLASFTEARLAANFANVYRAVRDRGPLPAPDRRHV
jgi:glycosyltransferase involved in cell wall biosynthesis